MSAANETALALMKNLGELDFWGTLTLKFQHGQVIHITKEESIQPEPKNRRIYDNHNNQAS